MTPGTLGYAERADELVERYEAIDFTRKHHAVIHLLPGAPARVLDIGAGTGADAAWFAQVGHRVVAVEPTGAFRARGMELHVSSSIEWVNDALPGLQHVVGRRQTFEVVMMSAVWMHLDEEERRCAMPVVASLVEPGGLLVMTLRHGPIPEGRVMFDVSAEETVSLALACGLRAALSVRTASIQPVNRKAGVTWTHLAFGRAPVKGAGRCNRQLAANTELT